VDCARCPFRAVGKRRGHCDILVAVAGQPNVGKSTLFNRITGEVARVGNFPGTTVEMTVGRRIHRGRSVCFIDLPGAYGLSASSLEERVTRRCILQRCADVYLVVVDATVPERTMYLAVQVLELVPNVVVALNKWDVSHKMGVHIHVDKLESRLGVPVIPVSGVTGEGVTQLLDTLLDVATGRRGVRREPLRIDYGPLETYIAELENEVSKVRELSGYPSRWMALMLLEGDEELLRMLLDAGRRDVVERVESMRSEIAKVMGRDPEELIAEARYRYVEALLRDTVVKARLVERESVVDMVFRVPVLGSVISIALLFLVFLTAFVVNTGFPLNVLLRFLGFASWAEALERFSVSGLLSEGFTELANFVESHLACVNPLLADLLAKGVLGGLGAVLSFFPLILVVAVVMSMLEDSGLGPRMAVALHSLFARFGLSGRAVYPLLIAFGCNVPAVLASRTAIDDVERLEIAMSVAFVPCQARLVVLLYFVFQLLKNPLAQSLTTVSIYVGGALLYLLSSKLFRTLLGRREAPELLLEIPPLHRPSARVVLWNSWDIAKHFLKKAGVIIFALSVATWMLLNLGPGGLVENPAHSYAAYLGKTMAPLLQRVYGLSSDSAWKVAFALINGFIAKEGLVTSIAELSGVSEKSAFEALHLDVAQSVALLIVMMYYVPCVATIAAIYQETRSAKLTIFTILYLLGVSFAISVAVFSILKIF